MKFLHRAPLILAGVFLLHPAALPAGQAPVRDKAPAMGQNISSVSPLGPQEAQQIVTLHNRIREEVGVAPLCWSDELAAYAQQWADHLVASRCRMEHRPRSGKWRQEYGENLFIGTAGYYGTSDAVMAWAAEKDKYRGGALHSSRWADAGHYTQMVWRNTMEIGCATGLCQGNLLVVCNYDPRGNFLGQSPY